MADSDTNLNFPPYEEIKQDLIVHHSHAQSIFVMVMNCLVLEQRRGHQTYLVV